ncbi:14207_t:CDS:1, partial [Ambispora leptoticha]
IGALFLKCQQISQTLGPIFRNVDNLLYEDHLELAKNIINFAGFVINIAYLQQFPSASWWFEVHCIEEEKLYDLLLEQEGTWYTVKAFFKYDNAPI